MTRFTPHKHADAQTESSHAVPRTFHLPRPGLRTPDDPFHPTNRRGKRMAVGGEEGDDEWELDGLLRTISVTGGRRKCMSLYALYNEREMPCEVTAHALIVFRPYLLTIESREVVCLPNKM
jgi:hypothetical protein